MFGRTTVCNSDSSPLANRGSFGSNRCGLFVTTMNVGVLSTDPVAARTLPTRNSLPDERNGASSGFRSLKSLWFELSRKSEGSISTKSFGTAMLTPSVLSVKTLKPAGTSVCVLEPAESLDRSD